MGDMKTPDFDDLLAAFDIPDATGLGAKENIQESHEESDSQLKHTGICLDESLLNNQAVSAADVPAISVIVKNTSQHESLLESLVERSHSGSLENGFRGQCASADLAETNSSCFSKPLGPSVNGQSSGELLGKAPLHCKPEGAFSQLLPHFSPVSPSGADKYDRSQEERDCFTEGLMEPLTLDNPEKVDANIFEKLTKDSQKSANSSKAEISTFQETCEIETDKLPNFRSESNNKQDCVHISCKSGTAAKSPSTYANSQTKLSSCLEALVALNAKRGPSEPPNLRESPAIQNNCVKVSPKVPISPRSPRSPLDTVKRLLKPSDSPVSVCSDSSGKGSPAVASASPAAIPRVRIKTIKTTSGHIKRTVTSVLPDSETDEVHSAYESSPCQSMISEDSYNMSPCPVNDSLQTKCATVVKSSPKLVLNKSEAISRRLGMSQSAAVVNNKRGSLKRVAQKPKKSSPTGSSPNPNSVPKAMHLASLNLVPHSVAATVTARSTCHQRSAPSLSSTVYSSVPLVHQVKSARPHPRDCVTNSAAGTLNRLLNHGNPVPTYVPDLNPPPESNISLPPHGYCCLECGDSFGVERSLMYHYSRRSVHIEVTCTHCRKTLVFFNRCALLAHAREHKNSGTVMQCTQLYMKPIAEEQMFVPLSIAPLNVDSCSFMSSLHKNQPVMPLYPDKVIRQRLCCMECNKQLADLKALAGHYQSLSETTDGLMCKVCSMFLPNTCSFRAHQRIHAHKSPYCCPECGILSRSADIQKHIRENCLHYARKAWYKCLHCDLVFKSLQGQKTHIDEKHCETFFKCSACPVAFKTSDRCEVHLTNKHNASKLSPQLIFKCSCETIFKKRHLLYQHFHQDAYKRVTCVFKCPKCHSVFALKQQLMQHFKGVHVGDVEKTQKQIVRSAQDKNHMSIQEKKADSFGKHTVSPRKKADGGRHCAKPSGWTCGDCHQWFPERDAYVSHVKSSHGKPMKRYPCWHCEQSFNFNTSLRKHIQKDHDGKNKNYLCWYCTDTKTTFTTSVMLKNHISLMHGIKNPDLAQMSKTCSQESNKSLGKKLRSEKLAVSTKIDEEAEDVAAPASKRMKMQFRCSKCGYVTDNSMEFQQHIPQHKTDENTPQCAHCGLCFTSGLALNRHLYIVHKVKSPEEEAKDHQPFTESRGQRGKGLCTGAEQA